jgi:hypothetical protein
MQVVLSYRIERAAKWGQEITPAIDRTLNRHRWIGREYLGV